MGKCKKCAFTLAEVLITLTILGVVAAISISTIATFYQKTMTIARLKVAYSMLENMTRQSYIENGYPPANMTMTKSNFNTYFGKYLKISKECGINGKLNSGCFKKNDNKQDTFYDLDGNEYSSSDSGYASIDYYKVLLSNGMSLGIDIHASYAYHIRIVVDIDGPNKGDSKLGQDVFMFTYYSPVISGSHLADKTTGAYLFYVRCQREGLFMGAYKGADTNCLPYYDPKELCTKGTPKHADKGYQNGSGCSGLIIKDGWKISSDYPWGYAHKKP